MPDSRMSASKVPTITPPSVANTVRVSVKRMPSRKRYGSVRQMTSKSKVPNICASLADGVAGHGHALFKEAHAHDDDRVEGQIKEGRCREGFEHLERELLHGAGAARQLEQADGERYRCVLDRVQELRRERRQDDPKCHRQE